MRKTTVLLVCILVVIFCNACDINAPLRNKMVAYYSQDKNYFELSGTVKSVEYREDIDELFIEMDILTDEHHFPLNGDGYGEFTVVNWSKLSFHLEINDTIALTSAPDYFYNGHILPIVSVKKGDDEYLSFAKGKANYLSWIHTSFA